MRPYLVRNKPNKHDRKRNKRNKRKPKQGRKQGRKPYNYRYDDLLLLNSREVVRDTEKDRAVEVCGCGGCCHLCVSAEKGCDCYGYCSYCRYESWMRLRNAGELEVLRFILGSDDCDCDGTCPNCYGRNKCTRSRLVSI